MEEDLTGKLKKEREKYIALQNEEREKYIALQNTNIALQNESEEEIARLNKLLSTLKS
jgi:hypothetical protein